MDWYPLVTIALVYFILFGLPAMEDHYKRRAEDRLAEHKRQMAELEEAIEEHWYWHRYGRPKPHRYHGVRTIKIGKSYHRVRYDCDKIVELL